MLRKHSKQVKINNKDDGRNRAIATKIIQLDNFIRAKGVIGKRLKGVGIVAVTTKRQLSRFSVRKNDLFPLF